MPSSETTQSSRIAGGLLGHLVGDALGVPVEFKPRTDRRADPVATAGSRSGCRVSDRNPMRIAFDHTIATSVSADQLWRVLEQSFRNSDASPIWPHALESVRSAQVETGALVRATYKTPGGLQSNVTYRFAEVEPGRLLCYAAEPSHPLRGGGTVEILPAASGCLLHWFGSYDVPWRPAALVAAAFTRLYFTGRFFAVLESSLREWEETLRQPGG